MTQIEQKLLMDKIKEAINLNDLDFITLDTVKAILKNDKAYDMFFDELRKIDVQKQTMVLESIHSQMQMSIKADSEIKKPLSEKERSFYERYYKLLGFDAVTNSKLSKKFFDGFHFAGLKNEERGPFFLECFQNVRNDLISSLYQQVEANPVMTKDEIFDVDNRLDTVLLEQNEKNIPYLAEIIKRILEIAKDIPGLNIGELHSANNFFCAVLDEIKNADSEFYGYKDMTLQYAKEVLKANPRNLIYNSTLSRIYNAIKVDILPKEFSQQLRPLIKNESIKVEISEEEVSRFWEISSKFETCRKDKKQLQKTFDAEVVKFYESFLEKVKIKYGTIPEEYCNCVIEGFGIIRGVTPVKDRKLIARVLEDFLINYAYIYEERELTVEVQDRIMGNNMAFVGGGFCSPRKTIKLANDLVIPMLCGQKDHLILTFHELQHAKQEDEMKEEIVDYRFYQMLKDQVLLFRDSKYYKENYMEMYREIDSRIAGEYRSSLYFSNLGIDDEKDLSQNSGKIRKEIELRRTANMKTIDGKSVDINKRIDEIMIQDGAEILKEFPQLAAEYFDNGQKKGIYDILTEFDEKITRFKEIRDEPSKRKTLNLYAHLLFQQRANMPIEELATEIGNVISVTPKDETVMADRNAYLRKNIFPQLEVFAQGPQKKGDKVLVKNFATLSGTLEKLSELPDNPDKEIINEIKERLLHIVENKGKRKSVFKLVDFKKIADAVPEKDTEQVIQTFVETLSEEPTRNRRTKRYEDRQER